MLFFFSDLPQLVCIQTTCLLLLSGYLVRFLTTVKISLSLVILSVLTIFLVRVLNPINTAAAEHHLVLRQSSRLISEEVLDLAQVLRDVQGPTLNPGIQLLVVQRQVIVDEVDLTQLHNLNGHVQRDGDQHLVDRNGL